MSEKMYSNKQEIIEILKNNFNSVYCDTCSYNDNEESCHCDECHRKMMKWGISDHFANVVVDKIIMIFREGDGK